jgi:transposase
MVWVFVLPTLIVQALPIKSVSAAQCPQAKIGFDPFHGVALAKHGETLVARLDMRNPAPAHVTDHIDHYR